MVFSDEHKFKQFKGGNPRHNFVWAKSVGWEGEGWGLMMRGENSAGRARLTWFSMKTLSTHPHTILKNSLLPAAKEWFGDEKEG